MSNDAKIEQLQALKDHLVKFVDDPEYRKELGRDFKGFGLSPDDFLALEAVNHYIEALAKARGQA